MAEPLVTFTIEDGIGIICLNRPDKLNTLNLDMYIDLNDIINQCITNDAVKVVIFTGNGRFFSAGLDVSMISLDQEELAAQVKERTKKVDLPESSLNTMPSDWCFIRIPKPTIAAVNGTAVGGGAEWATQCDIRIASENASFGWVFSLRGIVSDTGAGPYLLPGLIGRSKALELMYSGEIIDAREAERIGLVSKVVPPEQLLQVAKEMAVKISKGAPLALKGFKELTYGATVWPPNVFIKELWKRIVQTTQSEDAKEGIQSFLEKRPPVWKGR